MSINGKSMMNYYSQPDKAFDAWIYALNILLFQ